MHVTLKQIHKQTTYTTQAQTSHTELYVPMDSPTVRVLVMYSGPLVLSAYRLTKYL